MSVLMISGGAIAAEHLIRRLYAIWWFRGYPLDMDIVVDGLGRRLVPVPRVAGFLFGHEGVWNRDMAVVDGWQLLAAALGTYLLFRIGVGTLSTTRVDQIHEPAPNNAPDRMPGSNAPGEGGRH